MELLDELSMMPDAAEIILDVLEKYLPISQNTLLFHQKDPKEIFRTLENYWGENQIR